MKAISVPKPIKQKNGIWRIQLRLGGQSIVIKADTEQECIRQATLRKLGNEYRSDERHNIPLTEAIDLYIASRPDILSPSTIRGYRTIQRNRFKGVMHRRIGDIKNWQTIVNNEKKHVSGKTLINSWRFISSVIRYCGYTPPRIALPQVTSEERAWLTWREIIPFCEAVKGSNVEIPALLALHSLRRSELCALTWKDIDLGKGVIHVRGAVVPDENHKFVRKKETKNVSSRRDIPIVIPQLTDALKAYKGEKIINVSPSAITQRIRRVCEKNNLKIVTPHGLRHSYASLCRHCCIDPLDCMRWGGWSNMQTMLKIYTHIDEVDRQESIKVMESFFRNA